MFISAIFDEERITKVINIYNEYLVLFDKEIFYSVTFDAIDVLLAVFDEE